MILTFSSLDMSNYRDVNLDPVLQRDFSVKEIYQPELHFHSVIPLIF